MNEYLHIYPLNQRYFKALNFSRYALNFNFKGMQHIFVYAVLKIKFIIT